MAKRPQRWGVHHRIKPGLFWEGLYRTRSSFTVRGRTEAEAIAAAEKKQRERRNPFEPFIVRRLS